MMSVVDSDKEEAVTLGANLVGNRYCCCRCESSSSGLDEDKHVASGIGGPGLPPRRRLLLLLASEEEDSPTTPPPKADKTMACAALAIGEGVVARGLVLLPRTLPNRCSSASRRVVWDGLYLFLKYCEEAAEKLDPTSDGVDNTLSFAIVVPSMFVCWLVGLFLL
jgi:hypothetical protein